MPMYSLIGYSDDYQKTSGSLCQYKKGDQNGNMTNSQSFKFKSRLNSNTNNVGIANVEIAVPLKYLSNFKCEINLMLTLSENCVICKTDRVTTFAKTDTKLYVPVVTLSTQDDAKLMEQLKSGLKRTTNWDKYQSSVSTEGQNQYLDYLIDTRISSSR